MTALAANRNTPEMAVAEARYAIREIEVAASTKIFAGSLVMTDANGRAVPGATATARVALGRAEALADNSSGAAGAIKVKVKPGVFKFANSGSDAVDANDLGKTCYIEDDQTVAETDGTGTRSAAGKVVQVDSDGVWVAVGINAIAG